MDILTGHFEMSTCRWTGPQNARFGIEKCCLYGLWSFEYKDWSFRHVCFVAKINLSNTIRPIRFFGFCYFLENTNFVPRQTLASSIMSPNGKLSKSWVNTDGISGFLSIKKKTLKRKHQKQNIKNNNKKQ